MNKTKGLSPRRLLDVAFYVALSITTLLTVGIALFQQYIGYEPVPVLDMQEGYLGFLEKINAGHWEAWIAPHNEHRIFLQRILFWIDNYAFHGTSVFLIGANAVFIGLNILFLALLGLRDRQRLVLLPLLVGWCFLLCQGENISWAFQGQFHLAYLVPLSGLYLLAIERDRVTVARMLGAVFLAWLSVGTMGNGVIAGPLFLIFALALRLPVWAVLVILCGNVIQFAFLRWIHAGGSQNVFLIFSQDRIAFVRFYLRLIGSPFYYLLGESDGYYRTEAFGAIYIALLLNWTVRRIIAGTATPQARGLAAFIGYVLVSYVGATVARVGYGINQALVYHYTTPAILGWAALALLYSDCLAHQFTIMWRRIGLVLFAIVMLNYQLSHIAFFSEPYFDERVTFLGLAMGVDDHVAESTLTFPEIFQQIREYSEPAYEENLGYFQAYPFSGIRKQLGVPFAGAVGVTSAICTMTPIEWSATSDPKFVRFYNWIDVNANTPHYPDVVRVLDERGVQIGVGLVRSKWVDRRELNQKNGIYRFRVEGYVMDRVGSRVQVVVEENRRSICRTAVSAVPRPMNIKTGSLSDFHVSVGISAVHNLASIPGGDGLHSNLCDMGLRVLGTSGARADADTGAIDLILKPGDTVLYRSGPTSGNQYFVIDGKVESLAPEALNWVELSVQPSLFLGKDRINVSIQDRGKNWGEWSAVAVKANSVQCQH